MNETCRGCISFQSISKVKRFWAVFLKDHIRKVNLTLCQISHFTWFSNFGQCHRYTSKTAKSYFKIRFRKYVTLSILACSLPLAMNLNTKLYKKRIFIILSMAFRRLLVKLHFSKYELFANLQFIKGVKIFHFPSIWAIYGRGVYYLKMSSRKKRSKNLSRKKRS